MSKLQDKKIIFLFTPGPIGGAEKIVLNGVKALLKANINIELWIIKEERVPHVANKFLELLKEEGIESRVFSSRKIYDRALSKELSRAFKEMQPDIIHAHGFKAAFFAHFAAPVTTDLIITHHGKTSHTLKVKIYEFIEVLIMKRASAVIAVSQDMRRMLASSGISDNKISVIENFMTSKIIPKKSTSALSIKILFVGRLSPEKGCSVLIDAMKLLPENSFILTILGDGVEREPLEMKVKDLKLSETINFTGFKQNVNEYMAANDAIIMPSFREGQPLTLIEACCMGLPVVASNVGGIPELVNENMNGYLCQAGNALELSQALIKLSQNIKILQMNASNSSSSYVDRFSSETWAKRTMNVYEMVLSH